MGIERGYNPRWERMETKDTVDAFNKKMEAVWPRTNPEELVTSGVRTRYQVDRRQAMANEAKANFDENEEGLALGRAAEYLFLEGAYKNGWLEKGSLNDPEIYILRTSEYDDYIEGVDMVVAIRPEPKGEWYYLGINITVTEDEGELYDKFNKTTASLTTAMPHLPIVEQYVPDEATTGEKAGQLSLPKTVVIMEKPKVLNAIKGYMDERKINLKNHEAQSDVIQSIRQQLLSQLRTVVQDLEGQRLDSASEAEVIAKAREHLEQGVNSAVDHILDSESVLLEYFSSVAEVKEKGLAA